MAELKGPILFTGSIGTIRAYYDKVLIKYFVSTKGGSTREMIMKNAAFARQRENMSEFKVCAIWAKHLRRSLLAISHLFQGYYFSEIMAMAKSIQKHDTVNLRGTQLPDFAWDGLKQEYLPVAPKMEKLSVVTFSDWKRVSSDGEDIVLTATFAEPALQFAGTTLVVALGLEVSMAEGDTSSMNRPGFGTMKIVECFV